MPLRGLYFQHFWSSPMFYLLWLCLELINLHEICTILKQNISCFISCNSVIFLGHTTHFVKVQHMRDQVQRS